MNTLSQIETAKIVAVVRAEDSSLLRDVAEALLAGGVNILEITFTVPKAHQVIEQLMPTLAGRCVVGAGTVLDSETARLAILAGAQFIVSPHTSPEIIQMSRRYSIPVMAGAMTPTEVLNAWSAGADIVKIFPAEVGGISLVKALRGPLPQVKLMPTGGIGLDNLTDFLNAGATAVGVGGNLVSSKLIDSRDFGEIQSRALAFRARIEEFETGSKAD